MEHVIVPISPFSFKKENKYDHKLTFGVSCNFTPLHGSFVSIALQTLPNIPILLLFWRNLIIPNDSPHTLTLASGRPKVSIF